MVARILAGWATTLIVGHLLGAARITQGVGIVITALAGSVTTLGAAWLGRSRSDREERLRERLEDLEHQLDEKDGLT